MYEDTFLSNIYVTEVTTGGEIPNQLTFLEMYGADKTEGQE